MPDPPARLNARLNVRRDAHARLSARLAALGDTDLEAMVAAGEPQRTGLGGSAAVLKLAGCKVFAKRIPLTDIERTAANVRSTANIFGLPLFYQYGVGSTGFGAWRELAANLMATDAVLAGDCPYFPLLYHSRVLPRSPQPVLTDEQQAKFEQAIAYWEGSAAIRARRQALRAASASLVLFLEYVPQTLSAWLLDRTAAGADAAEAAFSIAEEQMNAIAAFLGSRGMLHFDLHASNVLTDGEALYAADFGLAICDSFDLSADERAFVQRHRLYDHAFVARCLVAQFDGAKPDATPELTARIDRYRPLADLLREFHDALRDGAKTTPYPAEAIERAHAVL